jgi:hypothetical protein
MIIVMLLSVSHRKLSLCLSTSIRLSRFVKRKPDMPPGARKTPGHVGFGHSTGNLAFKTRMFRPRLRAKNLSFRASFADALDPVIAAVWPALLRSPCFRSGTGSNLERH